MIFMLLHLLFLEMPAVFCVTMILLERWPSGRRRTTRNRVYAKSVSRVQIPLSPPTFAPRQARGLRLASQTFILISSGKPD